MRADECNDACTAIAIDRPADAVQAAFPEMAGRRSGGALASVPLKEQRIQLISVMTRKG
jgi:hypothetical protein